MSVRIGQKVPDFSLPDAERNVRSLGEFVQQGSVLLVFFPFAFSGTCDKEMCTFRDSSGAIQDLSMTVVGVSVDSSYSLKAFAQTYNLSFTLLSDFNKKVSKLYGVLQDPWTGLGYRGVAKRAAFLVDRRFILRYKWMTDTPSEEPPYVEIMKAAQKLLT